MSKLKRFFVSPGFETSWRRRYGSRNQEHLIRQGDRCLVIRQSLTKHNYGMGCAALMLQKAKEEMTRLAPEMERAGEAFRSASG